MIEIVPRDCGQVWDALSENSWPISTGRFRSHEVFRGLSDVGFELTTSLKRRHPRAYELEGRLIDTFEKYLGRDLGVHNSIWHVLSLAQHYGVPTRLLDWTISPFVALHFATCDLSMMHADGVVWCVNFPGLAGTLPSEFRDPLKKKNTSLFSVELLTGVASSLSEFDNMLADGVAVFFEPHAIDERISAQRSLFSVMSSPCASFDEWIAINPDLVRKVVIPASLKWPIRDRLDQINMNERVLFPGLGGLAQWLSRHYLPCDAGDE